MTTLQTLLLASTSLFALACTQGADTERLGPDKTGGTQQGLGLACPPTDLLEAALCICDDFNSVGRLDIVEGPSGVASMGVNGHTNFVNSAALAGGLTSYAGFDNAGSVDIQGTLATAGSVDAVGALYVHQELNAGGDLVSVGDLAVDGVLRVLGQEFVVGDQSIASRGDYEAVAAPCACEGAGFFDVQAAVLAAKQSNDNASIDLEAQLLSVGESSLLLESGTYYLEEAAMVGLSHITISGSVSLFVDGSIDLVGSHNIALEAGATLDLFVSGRIATVGNVSFGSESDPQALRLYVGGQDSVAVSVGEQEFFGSIYAPQAKVVFVGDTRIVGSLFAKSLDGVGDLEIAFGSPASLEPDSCETPEEETPEEETPEEETPEEETPEEETPEEEGPQID